MRAGRSAAIVIGIVVLLSCGAGQTPMPTVVVLDPGHGGEDPGAASQDGTVEKAITLQAVTNIAAGLAASGYEVNLTRTDDRRIPLADRSRVAEQSLAGAMISIHVTFCNDESVSGIVISVPRDDPASQYLGEAIAANLRSSSPLPVRRVVERNYKVFDGFQGPRIMIDIGFITSPADQRVVAEEEYHRVLSDAVVAGLTAMKK